MNTVQPLILAAGKGKRMNNPELPKVLTPLHDRPIISYLLESVKAAGFLPPALVVGFHQEKVRETLGEDYTYVEQPELLGTGHAVMCAEGQLAGKANIILVLNGDQILLSTATMQELVRHHQESGAVLSLATLTSEGHPTFQSFGRIIRDGAGEIAAIREYRDASPEEQAITEVNPGLYCFDDLWLWQALKKLQNTNAQNEYYLTDLFEIAISEGLAISSVPMASWEEGLGVNSPEDLAEVEKYL